MYSAISGYTPCVVRRFWSLVMYSTRYVLKPNGIRSYIAISLLLCPHAVVHESTYNVHCEVHRHTSECHWLQINSIDLCTMHHYLGFAAYLLKLFLLFASISRVCVARYLQCSQYPLFPSLSLLLLTLSTCRCLELCCVSFMPIFGFIYILNHSSKRERIS